MTDILIENKEKDIARVLILCCKKITKPQNRNLVTACERVDRDELLAVLFRISKKGFVRQKT